jgi:hypothetical protein
LEKCRWRIALKAAAFQDIRAILYFASIMCNFLPASLPVTPPELRTKLTTSRRESLLKHCRKSHRERQSEREREKEICDTTFYRYRDFRENKKFLHND